jgi:redox-regulated HSP33 family molecular chaperone
MTIVFNDGRLQKADWKGKLSQKYTEAAYKSTDVRFYNRIEGIDDHSGLIGSGDLTVTYLDGKTEKYVGVSAYDWAMLGNKGSSYFFYSIKSKYLKS